MNLCWLIKKLCGLVSDYSTCCDYSFHSKLPTLTEIDHIALRSLTVNMKRNLELSVILQLLRNVQKLDVIHKMEVNGNLCKVCKDESGGW